MSTPNTPITKTCSSCGEQKPLSAFLQLTGTQGGIYGNICSSCRKANLDKPKLPKDLEGSTTSSTGVKIDSKTKVKEDVDKREIRKQIEEQYFEERDELEEIKEERIEKIQHKAKDEKKHRETFLDKRSYLETHKKPYTSGANNKQVVGGEHQAAKEREINLAAPVLDTQIAGKEKYKSAVFNQFKAWLGGSAPIVRTLDHSMNKANVSSNKNTMHANKTEKTDALSEYIEKSRGPGSRK